MTPFQMLLGVCMTLMDAGHDIWPYNAVANSDAMASALELNAICEWDYVCNDTPLQCTLVTSYTIESPMCWDHDGDMGCMETRFVDVPVVNIECSNVLNCSPFATLTKDVDLSFNYIPDPSECCRMITHEN